MLRATWRGLETWHGRATCRRASPRPYRRAGCGNGVMATPLRHRQTKEAANRYVQPKATAPHLDSTRFGLVGLRSMSAGLHSEADARSDQADRLHRAKSNRCAARIEGQKRTLG